MASGIILMTSSATSFEGRILYTYTTNKNANTSSLTLTYQVRRVGLEGSIGGNTSPYSLINTITSDNNVSNKNITYSSSGYLFVDNDGTWLTIHSSSHVITHASDGTASLTMTCRFNGTYNLVYFNVENASIVFDTIIKEASLTSAPNFNNNDNPTITYTNPMGTAVDGLSACISFDGSVANIAYRSVSKTGTSYTFNLTTAERNTLINGTSGSSRTVRFILRMYIGGKYYYSVLHRTFTLSSVEPTLDPTVVDTNSTTINLTGNSNKLVRYFSNAKITFNEAVANGATITSKKCACGDKSITNDGTIYGVESGTFVFTATDSRGFTATETVYKTIVPYVKLTTKLQLINMDTNGTGSVLISGNLFRGSFGSVENTPVVSYRYREQGGTWGNWKDVVYSITNDSYSATVELYGLDYQKTYEFEAKAVDSLMTVNSELTIRCLPVFDWGENDFQFNVPVYITGNLVVSGTISSNDPAAQADADPMADYIVATGITDGWTWRKWNSGIAECWCKKSVSTTISTAWGSLFASGPLADSNLTLPFTFADVPVINVSMTNNGSGVFIMAAGSWAPPSTTATGAFELVRAVSSTASNSYGLNYQVNGRWK